MAKKKAREIVAEHREQVVRRLLSDMRERKFDWVRPWAAPPLPCNPMSRQATYRGGNVFHLLAASLERGCADPRWSTWKQIDDKGWHVRRGAKSVPVEFWKMVPFSKKEDGDGSDGEGPAKRAMYPRLMGYYRVFNWSEVEGAPEWAPPEPPAPDEVMATADRCIASWRDGQGCTVTEGAWQAAYSPAGDAVYMPDRGLFGSSQGFLRVLLHEMSHSTGHAKRLARPSMTEGFTEFGSPEYAFEELVAELGAMFSARGLGCPVGEADGRFYENHAAYLQSWMRKLEEDPDVLFKAAAQAQKAADLICGTCSAETAGLAVSA